MCIVGAAGAVVFCLALLAGFEPADESPCLLPVFVANLAAVSPLRDRLRGCLAALPMPPTRQDEVILAVAEAAANVVEHAYPSTRDDRGVVEFSFAHSGDV
jgi:anti-sigma regulatory factor (Ser/Thr protein kinase)